MQTIITKSKLYCKFLTAMLFAGIVIFLFLQNATTVYATEAEPGGSTYADQQGIVYRLDDGQTCYVNGYTKEMGDTVTIPVQLSLSDGIYTVKGIDKSAFQKCRQLKKIEIPNSVADIHAGTFSDCSKLTDIHIIPTNTSVKKSGKSMAITANVNAVLFHEAKNVKLVFDKDAIGKDSLKKGTGAITLTVSASVPDGYRVNDSMPESVLLQESAVQAIADGGKSLKIRMKNAEGRSCYIKINADDIKPADGEFDLTLQEMEMSDAKGTFRSDLKKAITKNGLRTDSIKMVSFSFGKGARANAEIIVPTDGVSGVKAGSKTYAYQYSKSKRTFATIFYHPYTVSRQGNVNLPLSKSGIFVVSGKPFQYMSMKLASGFFTESGNTYYIDKNGNALRGWAKLGNEYYYFDREDGKMPSGGKAIDGIQINKDGTAEKTDANVRKIQTMIKARTIVGQVTNASDSSSQKIEKCFRWIFQFPYHRYRRLQPICRQAGWEVTFANDIFDHQQGCCVSESAALAFMFHECDYKTVYVASDTGHAWVELNGRVYDPLFAEARGFSQYYNVPYSSVGLHPVIKRKI